MITKQPEQQGSLLGDQTTSESGAVECLGMRFESEVARRKYFRGLLKNKLEDPVFHETKGFPIGSDEDILQLSDPPYYVACPNPFLPLFIQHYGKPYDPSQPYSREPFAADVSEGKNDPVYNAHSYHTKVPHKAIMRYILHYTEPGDIVFDGFCGTGMTGVAAQFCGSREAVLDLGYRVLDDGTILDEDGEPFSRLGARFTVLNDLSPVATFIASNYNTPVDPSIFEREAKRILSEVKNELGWMYQTAHTDGKTKGWINFTLWSDVFSCPHCQSEIVFWDSAVNAEAGKVEDKFACPSCKAMVDKRGCERAWAHSFDAASRTVVKAKKQVPVLINYSVNGKRFEKRTDKDDLELIRRIQDVAPPVWFPDNRMMAGGETRRNDRDGITHVHHFYSARNLMALSAFRDRIWKSRENCPTLGLWFTSSHVWATRLNRLLVSNYFKKRGGVIGQTLQGTLYISSVAIETNAIERFDLRVSSVPFTAPTSGTLTSTCSTQGLDMPDNSADYLFVDPPFGANIAYSELNFLWESWLRVFTRIESEAIENKPHGKGLAEYRVLMRECFKECYRVLKPGRWMTVEFSNTRAAVWNCIQTALSDVGFVVANVSILEKSHKGYRAVTTPTAVKQDLVISAYKPNGGFEDRFDVEAASEDGVWDFVRTHLRYLPVIKKQGDQLATIPERDPRILFDQMLAYYVRKGYPIPISSQDFQLGLSQRFLERDGMYMLPEQAAEYDRKRMAVGQVIQGELFVCDESSAIQWLRQILKQKPQTYAEIHPQFLRELGGWSKSEEPLELSTLLEQSFLRFDGAGQVPGQIHSYLSSNFKDLRGIPKDDPTLRAKAKDRWYVPDPAKAGDLEKLRERALLREFGEYRESKLKKLKVFRVEAVRAGFRFAWQQNDYAAILAVAEKIPDDILQEDAMLLLWYTNSLTRTGRQS